MKPLHLPLEGHDLLAVERFKDDTRHMAEFLILSTHCPLGRRGQYKRLFLTEDEYALSLIHILSPYCFFMSSMLTLPYGFTPSGLSRLFCSFLFFRWARYLESAAFRTRPVNLVALTVSVNVLFSTSSCIKITPFCQDESGGPV